MGKIVAVWSPAKKTGKTVFLYLLSEHMRKILDQKVKILLCCVNLNYGNLTKLMNINDSELNLEDIVNLKIHSENGLDLINTIAKRNNVYFIGSRKTSSSYANRHLALYESLLEEFRQRFDLVFIDTISGNDNTLTNMILQKSDSVITVLEQDHEILEKFQQSRGRENLCVMNKYRAIYPELGDISSKYNVKGAVGLEFCDMLQELKNKGKLEFYTEHQTPLNASLQEFIKCFAAKNSIPLARDTAMDSRKRGIFGWGLGGVL